MSAKAASSALQNRFLEVTQDQQALSLTDVHSLDDLWPVMREEAQRKACLLYTSDAADDLTRVDLGGRRIIKKKM